MEPDTRSPESRQRGLSALPTSEIVLPPKFIEDLEEIAPKKRRSKLWYVVGLALVGVAVWLGVSRSAREIVVARARQLVRHDPPIPATAAPTVLAPPPVEVATAVASASVTVASAVVPSSATPSTSSSAKPVVGTKKFRRPPAHR